MRKVNCPGTLFNTIQFCDLCMHDSVLNVIISAGRSIKPAA